MKLEPLNARRHTESLLYSLDDEGRHLIVKRHTGRDAESRCSAESRILRHWLEEGFHVPRVVDVGIPELEGPYLVIERLEGESLRSFLTRTDATLESKLDCLSSIFRENAERHARVLANRDRLLIHTDPNTDNVLLVAGVPYHIDFEHISKRRDLLELTAREAATFWRRAATDLGARHLDLMMARVDAAYQGRPEVLETAVRISRRRLSAIQRWRNNRKHKRRPGVVTRYDVAESLLRRRDRPPDDHSAPASR